MLCISVTDLKEVLGEDVKKVLEQNLLRQALRRSPTISLLSSTSVSAILGAMVVKNYSKGQKIEDTRIDLLPYTCSVGERRGQAGRRAGERADTHLSLFGRALHRVSKLAVKEISGRKLDRVSAAKQLREL